MPGGCPQHAPRLHPNDPRLDNYTQEARDRDLVALLLARNAQLPQFITLITVLCPYTLTNNLDQLSTSFQWVINYLEQYYNIQKSGAHFLSISDIRFNSADSYENFYMELHGAVEDSLRKRGERLLYKNDEPLDADKEMSPTLENMVVMMWLEQIDPRLPKKVSVTFAHQMVGSTSLISPSSQPGSQPSFRSWMKQPQTASPPPTAAAASFSCGNSRFRRQRRINSSKAKSSNKFCRVCFLLNKGSPNIYTSHTITTCNKLMMTRGAAITLDDESDDPDHPTLIPGWDTDED